MEENKIYNIFSPILEIFTASGKISQEGASWRSVLFYREKMNDYDLCGRRMRKLGIAKNREK